jgi:hypothetical protein
MEEAQISLRFGLTLFHCRSCLLPLKPPTFKVPRCSALIVVDISSTSMPMKTKA